VHIGDPHPNFLTQQADPALIDAGKEVTRMLTYPLRLWKAFARRPYRNLELD
jgi:hypothetical protein